MLSILDNFFTKIERKNYIQNTGKGRSRKAQDKGLGSVLRSLFVSKEYDKAVGLNGVDGWKDDKEKFKIDLLNDIKTFLFGKWEKPWIPGLIFDAGGKVISGFRNVSGRVYHNHSNVIALEQNKGESPFFITLSKVKEVGGKVCDRTKETTVISFIPIADEEKGKNKNGKYAVKYMLPKFHSVVNVDFTEGVKKPKFKKTEFKELELNEYVENFIKELVRLKRIPKLIYDQADRCLYQYSPTFSVDEIHLVEIKQFKKIEEYYSTLFHEITHSTKRPARAGRGKFTAENSKLDYANEELVAEMGAMIICSELGLEYNRQNSITYLKGWLKGVKGSTDEALIEAYSFACDAAEFLLKDIDREKLVPESMAERAGMAMPEEPTGKSSEKNQKTVEVKKIPAKRNDKYLKPADTGQLSLFGFKSLNSPSGKIKTYHLSGDLGEFLGEFDRNQYTIALRGEKGAGKSRLLYQLVNAFASKKFSCAIISAESSPDSLVAIRYKNEYIKESNLDRIEITGNKFDFDSLNQICKAFDVVALDSWTKMESLIQTDFDRLQKENPETIIVSIFQSTTGKVVRGGNQPEYDCGTVIQVNPGGKAVCEKNRYAPTDCTYNVFEQKIERKKEERKEDNNGK